MVESPNPEMQERLRALCRQITVAEEIDPEIQEELVTHMEDKLNAYLHGAEPITDEDAYLLVREHFGNPAVVKALLQHTHVQEANVSLGRRLAAIAVLSLGCHFMFRVLNMTITAVLLTTSEALPSLQPVWGLIWTAHNVVFTCLFTGFIWYIVVRWQGTITRGKRPWFIRWSTARVIQCLLGTLFLFCLVPSIGVSTGHLNSSGPAAVASLGWGLAMMAIVAQSVAWLWWCDRPPRSKRSLSYATLAWMMFGVCGSMPILVLSVSGDAVPGTLTLGEFADVTWSLGVTSSYLGISYAMAAAFAASAAIGYAGRAAYWIARRMTNRPSDMLRHDRPDYFPHFDR